MTTIAHVQPADLGEADRALKSRHATMWALGNYPAVVTDLISPLGPALVEAAGIGAGDTVLDVAAGSGNVAIPAARTGAHVIASDLTPELLATGKREAAAAGVDPSTGSGRIEWETGDAEALPYPDAAFDAVLSCVGVMFAPHHQAAADELLRVCRPGGTIGLISWTPAGFIGQMFAAMKPYAPPPPPGAQPPPLWGDEQHVRGLLGDRVGSVRAEKRKLEVTHFATPESFRDYFKSVYGPTVAVFKSIAEDQELVAALDEALAELGRRFDRGNGSSILDWEYLLLTARRR